MYQSTKTQFTSTHTHVIEIFVHFISFSNRWLTDWFDHCSFSWNANHPMGFQCKQYEIRFFPRRGIGQNQLNFSFSTNDFAYHLLLLFHFISSKIHSLCVFWFCSEIVWQISKNIMENKRTKWIKKNKIGTNFVSLYSSLLHLIYFSRRLCRFVSFYPLLLLLLALSTEYDCFVRDLWCAQLTAHRSMFQIGAR